MIPPARNASRQKITISRVLVDFTTGAGSGASCKIYQHPADCDFLPAGVSGRRNHSLPAGETQVGSPGCARMNKAEPYSTSVALRQHDDQFGLRVRQIAGDVSREVACTLDGFPGRTGLG